MPTYDYVCQACNHEFEEMQKISASPLASCPLCKKETSKRKIGGGIGLNFMGSGFYCTDYGPSPKVEPSPTPKCCPCGKNTSCS